MSLFVLLLFAGFGLDISGLGLAKKQLDFDSDLATVCIFLYYMYYDSYLDDYHKHPPSVLWQCKLGHQTSENIVSNITQNVTSGTLTSPSLNFNTACHYLALGIHSQTCHTIVAQNRLQLNQQNYVAIVLTFR